MRLGIDGRKIPEARQRGGVASNNKITSGAASASRIGFKGSEDLGGGMAAIFTLESGVKIDTGELDATNTLFNRQAFVGLKTTAGTVTLAAPLRQPLDARHPEWDARGLT